MPIRIAVLSLALVLGACTGKQLVQGTAGFIIGGTVESVGAAVTGEPVAPAFVDGGFEGAVDAAYPEEEEETDLKVILTEETW